MPTSSGSEPERVRKMAEVFCVIMAGGRGERFWPLSRKARPKQMLSLLGGASLLEQAVLRLQGFVDTSHIFIVTNQAYTEQIRTLCSQLPPENVIGEPCVRDTAPCMALAAGVVKAAARTGDPVMMLLPSDHFITNRNAMIADFQVCCESALKYDALATIGIVPDCPSPEYGYIECGERIAENVSTVKRFREKPTAEVAARLLAAGNFKWNSGMFAFPIRTSRRETAKNAPDLLTLSDAVAAAWGTPDFLQVLAREYEAARKISVDYAIMEHAEKVIVKDASFDWDDIGNWTALRNHFPADENGNISSSSAVLLDCRNCIVFSEDRSSVIAGIDLEDVVLIKTADAVLACPVKSVARIKALLAKFSGDPKLQEYL